VEQPRRIGTFRISPQGELLFVDDTAARIAGHASPTSVRAGATSPFSDAEGRVRARGREGEPTAFEQEWRGPSGERRCARVILWPARSSAGEVEHFDGVVEELEPRASLDPASSMGFVASLMEGLPNPVFVKDEQHRWVLLNAALCRFMGHERGELLGKSDFDYFPPEEARVFWAKDDEVFAGGGVNENEEQFTDASGRTHVIITRKTLHVDEQGRRFLLGVITDITALREATEQLRASRDLLEERVRQRTAELTEANERLRDEDAQRAAFLNVLGHELRNPISAIRTSAYVMERAPPEAASAVRAREVVARQVQHLMRLCDDLLDVARLAHGKLELHRQVLELAPVVRVICDDQRALFEAKGIGLAFEGGPAILVDVDVTRLTQTLGNVLHNALKFTPPGGRVDLRVRRVQATAEVVVRDTGVGMEPADVARMFEPFVQSGSPHARAHGGLGLGLALARGLVEAQGGQMTARSEGPGLGLEVAVRFPLAAPARHAETPRAAAPPRRDLSVVVIDDNGDVRDTLADLLRLEGHRVHVAADGRSGVELVRTVRPDAVLCDLGLPDMDGCDVARAVRSDAAIAGTALIALSGFAHPDDVQRAQDAGFDAHLLKPPSIDELGEALARAAGLHR